MRLSPLQIDCVLTTVREVAGARAKVWLFGSRLDDERRGGDVDLLLQSTPPLGLAQRAQLKNRLEQRLNLPVDLLLASDQSVQSPFVRMAMLQGVCLQ
jgi:hypothetical protein